MITEGQWAVRAYVELVPQAHWPENWEFQDVEFTMECVPWKSDEAVVELCRLRKQSFRTTFSSGSQRGPGDQGWSELLTSEEGAEKLGDILSPEGYLLIRAEVLPESALRGPFVRSPFASGPQQVLAF